MMLNNTNANQGQLNLIYMLYGGLILFFLYRMFKNSRERKKVKGNQIREFNKTYSKWIYILGGLIVVFGVMNIIAKQYLAGALMIILVLVLLLDQMDKILISEEGIYGQGTYIEWHELKKWAYNENTKDLNLITKAGGQEKNNVMKVDDKNLHEINDLIRKYKLGK